MGREIRRVPIDWEHPRYRGHYVPLFDQTYIEAIAEWEAERTAFLNDPEEQARADMPFEKWHGAPPCRDYYRPEWLVGTATAYQVYETVSEGTPVSPVFGTEADLRNWLIAQGYSERAADKFIVHKWAPSMVTHVDASGFSLKMGIDSMEDMP